MAVSLMSIYKAQSKENFLNEKLNSYSGVLNEILNLYRDSFRRKPQFK